MYHIYIYTYFIFKTLIIQDDFVPYGFFQLHDEFNKFHVCDTDLCNGDTTIPGDNSSKTLLGNFFLFFSSIMIAIFLK